MIERVPQQKLKTPSNFELWKLGVKSDFRTNTIFVDKIEDLRKAPHNMVIAEAEVSTEFWPSTYKKRAQRFEKKVNYVMSMGAYSNMYCAADGKRILKPSTYQFKNIYKPYTGQDLTDKTLLIWRQGGIGDLLFIQPNLIYLKEKYPTCKIIFGAGPQYQSMLREWNCIDKIVDIPFSQSIFFPVDYHAIFEGVIERTREAEKVNAYELFTRWIGLNLPIEKLRPKQTPTAEALEYCKKILNEWKIEEKSFIIIQMRASSPLRTPRPEFWINILNELSKTYNLVLTDIPEREAYVESIIQKTKNPLKLFNFSKYSDELTYNIAMISLSKMALGTDSSLVHIAESLDVKNFGIYGPFIGEVRLSTYKNSYWVNARTSCAPCFRHGNNINICSNPKDGYATCFDKMSITVLVEKIREHIENV
jgi:ADP-heptose:LPS heptosyltransferase